MAGYRSAYDVDDLDRYYTDCVIGGPGAFMVPVNDWSQFPEADQAQARAGARRRRVGASRRERRRETVASSWQKRNPTMIA